MTRGGLRPGTVLAYPYLWRWQETRGETEGRKDRPVCVLAAVTGPGDGHTHLVILAISSQPPRAGEQAIEIPQMECRRAGLSDWAGGWVTVSEYNYDIAERSYYLDPRQEPLGRFSKPFTQLLAGAAAPLFRHHRAKVDRTE